jgi:hypothetical protein
MATDPQARIMTLGWQEGGKRGTVKLALGTLNYLGLPLVASELSEVTYSVGSKAITRRMYPGGPTLSYNRPAQEITRTLGGGVSRAKTEKKLILKAADSSDTIYFTGPQNEFVKWFAARCQGAEEPVKMLSAKGNPLAVIDRRSPVDPA